MLRIVITGGGSGGHVYPLLAVVDALKKIPGAVFEITYVGPKTPQTHEFEKRQIRTYAVLSSKLRRYFDIQNILDIPKFFISLIQSLVTLYRIMPDVVFSKGGPASFPVVFAAWFYRIPVLIQESDAVPGLANRLAARFATKIGIAFSAASAYFPKGKTALVGNPLRAALTEEIPSATTAKVKLGLHGDAPLLVVLGGSQGSRTINTFVLENLKLFLPITQIFHQTGLAHNEETRTTGEEMLKELSANLWSRYKSAAYLDVEQMKTALAAADIVLSRSGASAITEIAAFRKPAILIPLDGSANDHQRADAREYVRAGAGIEIDEKNLTPHLFQTKLKELLENPEMRAQMSKSSEQFYFADSAEILAKEIVFLGQRGQK